MKLFNARLDIDIANPLTDGKWTITALATDLNGNYFVSDISIGDNIFCYGMDQNTGETSIYKYKVLQKLSGCTPIKLVAVIGWAEQSSDYAQPITGGEAIIGKCIQGNMTAITNSSNNVSNMMIETARNIDLATASFTGSMNKRETVAMTNNFLLNKTYTIGNIPKDSSDVVILNGMVLTKGTDYMLSSKTLTFATDLNLTLEDTLIVLYTV